MKRLILVALMLALSSTAYAGVVDDAKEQIAKEKKEAMVAKAKVLLERKAKAGADLDAINKKLSKLDDGEDVEVYEPTIATGTLNTIYLR